MPTKQGLTCFLPLPHPKVRRNVFPVASVSFIALHPLFPETALGFLASHPIALCVRLRAMRRLLSPGLSFKIFSPFLFSFGSSIKNFCIFVCQPLC